MEEVPITLGTLSGCTHRFNLHSTATVAQGKCWIAEELGRPAELQRWLLDGTILEDAHVLSTSQASDSKAPLEILCVFLPRTFDVQVKVVRFSPGAQAQSSTVVTVSVSPMMTIDAAKFEALSLASDALGAGSVDVSKAARLIKGGLHLQDDRTIEYYHINPDATLHLIIPRSRNSESNMPGNASGIVAGEACENDNVSEEMDREMAMFHRLATEDGSSADIIKKSSHEDEDKVILSPRKKEAASMFSSMGVHRLRPRRCKSVPAVKSTAACNSPSAEPQDGEITARHVDRVEKDCVVQLDSTKCSSQPLESGAGPCSAEPNTQVCQVLTSEIHTSPSNPQKPSEPRAAPSRPLRRNAATSARARSPSPSQAMQKLLQMHSEEEARSVSITSSPTKAAARPPTPTMTMKGPPRMPRASSAAAQAPVPVADKADLGRPSCSRGQRDRKAAASVPTRQTVEAKGWEELFAPTKQGHAQLQRAPLRRSSSCRPEGIDRFHFVARLYC
jgi:hypothetical protein